MLFLAKVEIKKDWTLKIQVTSPILFKESALLCFPIKSKFVLQGST